MSGFPIIDLVLGLLFIYLILSIISSSLVEIILGSFNIRRKVLKKWLLTTFDNKMLLPDGTTQTLGYAIMDHSVTSALSKKGKANAFIDSKNFVSSLLEKLTFDPNNPLNIPEDIDQIVTSIKKPIALNGTPLLSIELQRAYLMYAYEAKASYSASIINLKEGIPINSEIQIFHDKLENWFDTSMDRVQGYMKVKYVIPISLVVSIIVVLALNADSVAISKYLYNNPAGRAKIAAQEYKTVQDYNLQKKIDSLAPDIAQNLRENQEQLKQGIAMLNESGIPLGWDDKNNNETFLTRLAGWLATVLAVMQGAPFWFDLLNKISNVRSTGAKPSTTDKNKKE